jgi:hypothetical protein
VSPLVHLSEATASCDFTVEESPISRDDADALAAVLPDAEVFESDFHFYAHIADVFAKAYETYWEVYFIQTALTVLSEPRYDASPLWFRLIRGYIDLAQYDDAYSAIMAAPHEDMCVHANGLVFAWVTLTPSQAEPVSHRRAHEPHVRGQRRREAHVVQLRRHRRQG